MIESHHPSSCDHFFISSYDGCPESDFEMNLGHRTGFLICLSDIQRLVASASRFLAWTLIDLVHVQLLFRNWILVFASATFAEIL